MMKATANEYVLLERGLTGFEIEKGHRLYVKVFDRDGTVIFHGRVGEVVLEVLGPKVKP